MGVRVVSDEDTATTDYVRVRTCEAPDDDTVTLATIQRFVERVDGASWKIRTLVLDQPMSRTEAMGLATCYAQRKHIPVVVADQA